MKNKKNNELSIKFIIFLLVICFILVIFVASCFAIYSNNSNRVTYEELIGGNLILNYTNNITGLSINNSLPISDDEGIKSNNLGSYFDFSIEVELDNATSIEYEIAAIKNDKLSNIPDEDIRIYLEKEKSGSYESINTPEKFNPISEVSKLGSPSGSMILHSEKLKKGTTDNYRLRVWLSDKSNLKEGNYYVEIVVNGLAS